ncbi:MAG: tetratricopeptide repeat protein [Lachnospiraceae bacterium]
MGCYKKILHTSNYLYNEGLEKANVRDLSGAVECLAKSLRYNKENTQARNLLGLVYYEIGETVLALREWVISMNFQSQENSAEKYLNEVQSGSGQLNAINQTIKKFNQALTYAKQKNEDLAIIQLKKVLSLNPNLVKAHQLLALIYIHQEQYAQAKDVLRKAGRIDANNTMTLKYLKEVNVHLHNGKKSKKPAEQNEELLSYQSGNETIIRPASYKDNTALTTVLNIIIGVVIGFLISYFLIVPNSQRRIKSEAAADLIEANDTIATKNVTIKGLEAQMQALDEELSSAQNANTATEDEINSYKQLLVAYVTFDQGEVQQAGEILAKIEKKNINKKMKDTYEAVAAKINEDYLAELYRDGSSAYNQLNYDEAITFFKKIMDVDETYGDGNTMYYLAQCYRNNGKNQKASELYQKVIELYPDTEKAINAQSYLDDME